MNNILKESSYSINKAVRLLNTNKLVSIKAETVYGLACDPSSIKSIKKLYDLKKRPYNNPLIIHISSMQMLNSLLSFLTESGLKETIWCCSSSLSTANCCIPVVLLLCFLSIFCRKQIH